MRIGIFGGSFNPPHKMHYDIASYLIDNDYVDKVIFVPTGNKYEYKKYKVSDQDRYEMIKIMIKDNHNMMVSDYEFKDKPVYTYETLDYFREQYTNDTIYFICGADNLGYIDTWNNSDYILTNYKFLVIDRRTDNLSDIMNRLDEYKDNITIVPMELSDISSTYIRNNICNLDDTYINKDVLNYIKRKDLYRNENL